MQYWNITFQTNETQKQKKKEKRTQKITKEAKFVSFSTIKLLKLKNVLLHFFLLIFGNFFFSGLALKYAKHYLFTLYCLEFLRKLTSSALYLELMKNNNNK